jgi:hypothetical protein
MKSTSHRKVTTASFDALWSIDNSYLILKNKELVANEASRVDDYRDVEFINVWRGRDDPHKTSIWDLDDEPHTSYSGRSFSAFNHCIDIKKGPGQFDDYDGYSYALGSGHKDEFQDSSDVADGFLMEIISRLSGKKIDEGIAWWFNDEYVHALGQPWYRGCSPALERYSFPEDQNRYSSTADELKARFPLAENTGTNGKGMPYSVFMPLDNMARYWYTQYLRSKDPIALGSVMHAFQDASVPHHSAGYQGNWHSNYERDLESKLDIWLTDPGFINQIISLFAQWNREDATPPTHLAVSDWTKTPARNWRIDQLVTWLALNSYREYDQTYHHFRNGYIFNEKSAKNLTALAIAMGTLVLNTLATTGTSPSETVEFNPSLARVVNIGVSWKIVVGNTTLLEFGDSESEARRALQIIQYYRMNKQCKIGKPTPAMTYYLVDGKAPSSALVGEDAVSFSPTTTIVKLIENRFTLVDGNHAIIHFGQKAEDAQLALRTIQSYGFTYICFVGRPDPSMIYFRR